MEGKINPVVNFEEQKGKCASSVGTEIPREVMNLCGHLKTWTEAIIMEHVKMAWFPFSYETNTKRNGRKPVQHVYEAQREAKMRSMSGVGVCF